MKVKHLSRAQAFAIRHDYQHLLDTPLDDNNRIDYVLVAPYSRILQWKFVQDVLLEEGRTSAILPDNPAGRFDVLLVSKASHTAKGFITKDLRSHLQAQGLPFDDARYFCLRRNDISVIALR